VHEKDSPNRQRFTIAHELGHWMIRQARGENMDEIEITDKRDIFSSTGADEEERLANRFAGALLMPASLLQDWVKKGLQEWQIASRLRVSEDALRVRLRVLGLARKAA